MLNEGQPHKPILKRGPPPITFNPTVCSLMNEAPQQCCLMCGADPECWSGGLKHVRISCVFAVAWNLQCRSGKTTNLRVPIKGWRDRLISKWTWNHMRVWRQYTFTVVVLVICVTAVDSLRSRLCQRRPSNKIAVYLTFKLFDSFQNSNDYDVHTGLRTKPVPTTDIVQEDRHYIWLMWTGIPPKGYPEDKEKRVEYD